MNDTKKRKRMIELTKCWRCMGQTARKKADKHTTRDEATKLQAARLYGTAQGYDQAAADLDELITVLFGQ